MKRIAAPMVGGLLTSAFLTLEIIPVIVTFWRQGQLLRERLADIDPGSGRRLDRLTWIIGLGALVSMAALVGPVYLKVRAETAYAVAAAGVLMMILAGMRYATRRSAARKLVWPTT
jgi:hypothetical protein